MPSALSCRALAPAASVADGCTAAAIREMGMVHAIATHSLAQQSEVNATTHCMGLRGSCLPSSRGRSSLAKRGAIVYVVEEVNHFLHEHRAAQRRQGCGHG